MNVNIMHEDAIFIKCSITSKIIKNKARFFFTKLLLLRYFFSLNSNLIKLYMNAIIMKTFNGLQTPLLCYGKID